MRVLFTPENAKRAEDIKTNERLAGLMKKYGVPRIDFFGDSWRIWFHDWHQHSRIGMCGKKGKIGSSNGSFTAHGKTLDEAMDRLETSVKDVPPSKGVHCRQGACPYYEEDFY